MRAPPPGAARVTIAQNVQPNGKCKHQGTQRPHTERKRIRGHSFSRNGQGHRGPETAGRESDDSPPGRRPHPPRRYAWSRQNFSNQHLVKGSGRQIQPYPVHSGPPAGRCDRHPHLLPEEGGVRGPQGPHIRQFRARRRNQPCPGESAVSTARGHAGAPGDPRRPDLPPAGALPRDGYPEPGGAGRHLSPPRGAGGPFHAQVHRRLPQERGGETDCPHEQQRRVPHPQRGGESGRHSPRPQNRA